MLKNKNDGSYWISAVNIKKLRIKRNHLKMRSFLYNYSATTLANFFLPRLIMRPSPLKSSRVYLVEISVTFSSATETPPCWIFLRPSPLESQSPAFTRTEMISSSPSGKSSAVTVTVGIFALLAPPAKSAWLASLAFAASSSP